MTVPAPSGSPVEYKPRRHQDAVDGEAERENRVEHSAQDGGGSGCEDRRQPDRQVGERREAGLRAVDHPHAGGRPQRQPVQGHGVSAGAEVDGHLADHRRERSRETFDEPETNPHHMRLRIRELSRTGVQVLGKENLGNADAEMTVGLLRPAAGTAAEDECAQNERRCSSGGLESARCHDEPPALLLSQHNTWLRAHRSRRAPAR